MARKLIVGCGRSSEMIQSINHMLMPGHRHKPTPEEVTMNNDADACPDVLADIFKPGVKGWFLHPSSFDIIHFEFVPVTPSDHPVYNVTPEQFLHGAQNCFRLLKRGGQLLIEGANLEQHREMLTQALREAGFADPAVYNFNGSGQSVSQAAFGAAGVALDELTTLMREMGRNVAPPVPGFGCALMATKP